MPSPRLDNIETIAKSDLPPTYHEFKIGFHLAEYHRVEEIYSNIDESDYKYRADNLRSCRTFAYFARHDVSALVKVISSACHLRWCPLCTTAKTSQISSSVSTWLKKARGPKLMTLTLKHSSAPLGSQIKLLYESFRTLRHRTPFARAIRGGIWFFQLKWIPETDEWHPHIHCLMDGNYLPKQWLCDQWLEITNGSFIVDIKAVKSVEWAARHVARYCARPCMLKDLPSCRALEVVRTMHGKRMCGTWGSGKECDLGSIKSLDKHHWKSIGSWGTVQGLSPTDSGAQAIIKAWMCGFELPVEIDLSPTDDFISDRMSAVASIAESYHTPYLYDS